MQEGAYLDVAQVTLYVFWIFFAASSTRWLIMAFGLKTEWTACVVCFSGVKKWDAEGAGPQGGCQWMFSQALRLPIS